MQYYSPMAIESRKQLEIHEKLKKEQERKQYEEQQKEERKLLNSQRKEDNIKKYESIKDTDVHTLTFAFFDDCSMEYEIEYKWKTIDEMKLYAGYIFEELKDRVYWFSDHYYSPEEIISDLLNSKYHVRNRYEKYYVLAFAIDHAIFPIWSKDCGARNVHWQHGEGEIVNTSIPSDYDVSPVIKLVNLLNMK